MFVPSKYKPQDKYFNAVTILQSLGFDDPLILPTEELRHADEMFRKLGRKEITKSQIKEYIDALRLKYDQLQDSKDPKEGVEKLLRKAVNQPMIPLNYVRGDLQGVQKIVFKTKDQLHREDARRHSVLTKRGHGYEDELPILAYISPRRPDKLQYLSKEQRMKCLNNTLPNSTGCPNPPSYQDVRVPSKYLSQVDALKSFNKYFS